MVGGGGRSFKKRELKEGVRELCPGGFLTGLSPEVKDSPNHPNQVRLEFQATFESPNGMSAAVNARIKDVTGRQKRQTLATEGADVSEPLICGRRLESENTE
jgi:hypothetical protein